VKLDHPLAPRVLMHAVDVLGDDGDTRMSFLLLRDNIMSCMGSTGQHRLPPEFVKGKDLLGILFEGRLAGVILPAVLAPDTAASPVGGNAAFSGHPGPGKKNDASIFRRIDLHQYFLK